MGRELWRACWVSCLCWASCLYCIMAKKHSLTWISCKVGAPHTEGTTSPCSPLTRFYPLLLRPCHTQKETFWKYHIWRFRYGKVKRIYAISYMYEDFSASFWRGGARTELLVRIGQGHTHPNKLNEGKGPLAFYSPTMDTTMKLLAAFFVPPVSAVVPLLVL